MSHIKPLAAVTPIWDRESSTYPETVRIAMEGGTVATYHLEVKQPKPILREALEHFEKTCFGGYEFKKNKKRPGKSDGERSNSNG